MIAKTRRKITQLRLQPEHVRLRTAVLISAGIGTVLAVISLAVLLPLQLYLLRGESEPIRAAAPSSRANIGGVIDTAPIWPSSSPSPSALP